MSAVYIWPDRKDCRLFKLKSRKRWSELMSLALWTEDAEAKDKRIWVLFIDGGVEPFLTGIYVSYFSVPNPSLLPALMACTHCH